MHTGCATYGNANLAITLFQLPSPLRSGGSLRPYRPQSDICASALPPTADTAATGANRKTASRRSLRNSIRVLIRLQVPSSSCATSSDPTRQDRWQREVARPAEELCRDSD